MKARRLIALCLVFVICFSFSAFAAEERTNTHIFSCYASISVNSSGDVVVSFAVTGLRTMTEIGATTIHIISSDGKIAETYYSSVSGNEAMMGGPAITYASSVTFEDAVPGTRYFAMVFFKASDSNGFDTGSYTTEYITA